MEVSIKYFCIKSLSNMIRWPFFCCLLLSLTWSKWSSCVEQPFLSGGPADPQFNSTNRTFLLHGKLATEFKKYEIDPNRSLFDYKQVPPTDCDGCGCEGFCFEKHCSRLAKCENGGTFSSKKGFTKGGPKELLNGDVPTDKKFACECPKYFGGQCCQTKICLGGSELIDGKCKCANPKLQSGSHCENVKCVHGGVATDGVCRHCEPPWTGIFCDELQCLNGGVLKTSPEDGSKFCQCTNVNNNNKNLTKGSHSFNSSGQYGIQCELLNSKTREQSQRQSTSQCFNLFQGQKCSYFAEAGLIAICILLLLSIAFLAIYLVKTWHKPTWVELKLQSQSSRTSNRRGLEGEDRVVELEEGGNRATLLNTKAMSTVD